MQQALGPLPVSPEMGRTRVEAAVALAHRVLAERDDPDQGDQVQSVVDPDARRGKHGASCDGYRLDLSLDAESAWLTALNLLPGNGDAAREAQTLLEAEERAQGHAVAAVSIDGIGVERGGRAGPECARGHGHRGLRAAARASRDALVRPRGVCPGCAAGGGDRPGGQQTATKERRANHTGWKCVFARRPCAGCPGTRSA